MKVSIIGATGYAGEELLRLLLRHPAAEVAYVTSASYTGQSMSEVYPHLTGVMDRPLASLDQLTEIAAASDVVFLALPHGHAMEAAKTIYQAGKKVIDLGADYRFTDKDVYEQWYKVPHTHREAPAVYGLTELHRQEIRQAPIIGNPGCYTTAAILALAPLVQYGLVDTDTVVVDAKSGISGAGRGLGLMYHFAEAAENVRPYNIGGHRHTPEIEQELSRLAGRPVVLSFTPHLIPMSRGILATCYARLQPGVTAAQVDEAFAALYEKEYFIRLLGRGSYPATKNVRGSNYCDIGWHIDSRTHRVVVVSALDNLMKGAAGQAVQNMNVMFGLAEDSGLKMPPLYP